MTLSDVYPEFRNGEGMPAEVPPPSSLTLHFKGKGSEIQPGEETCPRLCPQIRAGDLKPISGCTKPWLCSQMVHFLVLMQMFLTLDNIKFKDKNSSYWVFTYI